MAILIADENVASRNAERSGSYDYEIFNHKDNKHYHRFVP